MPAADGDVEKKSLEHELKVQRQTAFASGLLLGNVTLGALLESFAEGVILIDDSGTILLANSGALQMFGYSEKELVRQPYSVLFPGHLREVHEGHETQSATEGLNAGKPAEELNNAAVNGRVEDEGWRIRKDGSRFWAEVIITALHDDSGNLQGFLNVTHDITEQKKTEDALRFSEERYRTLFHENPTMIVTLDADWKMLSVNPTCAGQLGYTIDELEGQSVLKLFHEDDHAAVDEQLQNCMQHPNQVHRWQVRKIRKDGERLWVEETAQAVYGLNGALNVLVVCQDVTAHKRADEALRESEDKFFKAFQTAPDPFTITSLEDGRYVEVNEAFERILEYRRDEVIGRTTRELGIWENPDVRDQVVRILREQRTVRDIETNFRSKTGTLIVGLLSAVIIEMNGKECLVAITKNITGRKRAEEEIEKLNADLTARAAELEAANQELEAFNYTVAHDLRQPLNVINGYCQVINELCGDKLGEQCKRYQQEIYDGTLRMNRLIDALLNFSHMGHVEPNRVMVDVSALAQEVVTMLKMSAPERQVYFRIADGITANADMNLLRVVLDNLLGNAWKYTSKREKAVIEFGAQEIDGRPVYFVRDNGAGFDNASADKLFLPFQRLPGAEEFRGFGIGLATVERIIRNHGGKVWAEGEPDIRATIYFTLSAS